MKAIIVDVESPKGCEPLTSTRSLAECQVGGTTLREALETSLENGGFELEDQALERSRGEDLVTDVDPGEGELKLFVLQSSWLDVDTVTLLHKRDAGVVVHDADARVLALLAPSLPASNSMEVIQRPNSFQIRYAWDLLQVNARLLSTMNEDLIKGELHERATLDGKVAIGEGSRVLPGTYIEGNVVIGKDCKIGPNCYLRGPTSIGDGCHVGQSVEVKASILMDRVSVGHLTYLGDSILGSGTNLGAGTITANLRHDGTNHRSMVDGDLIDTGRRKLGVIIGDEVHTGIHTTLYPGRKLWPHTSTRPGEIVSKDILS